MEYETGQVVASKNGNERMPIASMTKIMALNLIFDEIDKGEMTMSDKVKVSENAARMGGSQVYLAPHSIVSVEQLIQAISICSANDATTAMAEEIGGSVSGFVEMMNEKAKKLGMENTHFANPTGLPNPKGYSSAEDVAKMMRELISHKQYFDFSRIRLCDFNHDDGRQTSMTNTNKLLSRYNGVDGGKTGFTNEAMHCISATACRNGLRFISVIVGGSDSKTRFSECEKQFDYGYQHYVNVPLISSDEAITKEIPIRRGVTKVISGVAKKPYNSFLKRGEKPTETYEIYYYDNLVAPIQKDSKVGIVKVMKNGQVVEEIELLASCDTARRKLFQRPQ